MNNLLNDSFFGIVKFALTVQRIKLDLEYYY